MDVVYNVGCLRRDVGDVSRLSQARRDCVSSPSGGGITNILFKAQGPSEIPPVLVRIYGDGSDVLIDREKDNHLFHELST